MQKSDSVQKTSFIKQHFKAIASAAVVLIPTIYTTLFLGSMWDPYGSIDDLPVAVVNHDQPVEYEEKLWTLAVNLSRNSTTMRRLTSIL